MILLDENASGEERESLRRTRLAVKQIGRDFGRKSMSDEEIIALLHKYQGTTLFTMDEDFYRRDWRHARYCLVCMEIDDDELAKFVRAFLKHPAFNTRAKRMGCVVWVTPTSITYWRLRTSEPIHLSWKP